jgi:hypothetical protein
MVQQLALQLHSNWLQVVVMRCPDQQQRVSRCVGSRACANTIAQGLDLCKVIQIASLACIMKRPNTLL